MESLYRSPIRVYVLLASFAIWGVWSGLSLPISLFPNSSQPQIVVDIPYGDYSASEFLHSHGGGFESALRSTIVDGGRVTKLTADYQDARARFTATFDWGTDGDAAQKEVQNLVASSGAAWTEEMRWGTRVNNWSGNGGFLAVSFYSSKRSLDELYRYLDPIFAPELAGVPDAEWAGLFNPEKKQVTISLDPEKMASLRVLPREVEAAIVGANTALGGGRLTVGDDKWSVEIPRKLVDLESIQNLAFPTRSGRTVHVRDVALVRMEGDESSSQYFHTNGAESVLLWANPKPGANIKRMSDQLLAVVEKLKPRLDADVEYRVLVNPSEFIDSSVHNVAKEVGIAAALAVMILFLFIGSFKNVATAAIEIPMSIVLAFILMKLTGVNINLISLGGLALSAGMNVDASVVVMENIFRHFEAQKGTLNPEERLRVLLKAVREVRIPVIASTIASVVVFLPLLMTKGLTNSILGDLAKAVVYSHSMSAIVALILVPTIRLQLMARETGFHPVSPIECQLVWLENGYGRLLGWYLARGKAQLLSVVVVLGLLGAFALLLVPRLPKELIGKPETDWLIVGVNPQTPLLMKEFISVVEKLEGELLDRHGEEVQYAFTQINGPTNGMVMLRLKDKRRMKDLWKKLEEEFQSTPTQSYWFDAWNPSELQLPNVPEYQLEIQGGTADERQVVANDLRMLLREKNIYQGVGINPRSGGEKMVKLTPNDSVIAEQAGAGGATINDLNGYIRVATVGKSIAMLKLDRDSMSIKLSVPKDRFANLNDLRALPIGAGGKIVSLSSLAQFEVVKKPASIYRRDMNQLHDLQGWVSESDKEKTADIVKQSDEILAAWKAARPSDKSGVSVTSIDTKVEMNDAIRQLSLAVAVSVLLIFITMVVQFGSIVEALLVMIPIPLGLLGVIGSLTIFRSTLSLNSVLGLILLNGIAVANSILIVDFIKRLVEDGRTPIQAAVEACRVRLRPILMTSLATVLGMMPIALGFGEGGKILQPLGISVSGGLWISMLLTLFLVPAAHVLAFSLRKGRA